MQPSTPASNYVKCILPIATVKYNGKPSYHAIIVAKADTRIVNWPDDAKGMRLSLADAGSTSGWLIPNHYFKTKGIDPKVYFRYRDGASHAAQVLSVINDQVDLASDYDRSFSPTSRSRASILRPPSRYYQCCMG